MSLPRALVRRPTLAAALLYAALSLAMVGQGLLPDRTLSSSDYLWTAAPWSAQTPSGVRLFGANGELADAVAAFQPFTERTRERLPHLALWNPDVMAGRPFLANMQSGIFSPFSLPAYVLPFWWSLGLIAALKLFCAAFGTFLLARALAIRQPGALLAGLAYGLSLYMVTWLAWPLASVWALLPWLLLLVDRVIRRPDGAGVAGLGAVTALQLLCGHPESSFHALAVAVLFAALRLSRVADGRTRRAGGVVLGLLAGAGLAAIVLLPFLELVRHSGDLAERGERDPAHIRRSYLLALAMPEYWGRPTQVVTEGFINARAFYAGALPLLLAVFAVARRPTRERVAIAAAAVVALMVVTGLPPVFQVFNHLPGFSQAVNTRLGIVPCLAIALLAGWGLDEVLAGHRPRRAVLAAAVLLPVAVVLARTRPSLHVLADAAGVAVAVKDATGLDDPGELLPSAAALDWLLLAGLGAVVVSLRRGPVAALAIGLVAVDLLRFGMGQNPAIPLDHARQPTTPAIRALQARNPARFVGAVPDFGITPLPADLAMRYGLQDARGYDYPVERRYDKLWRAAVAPKLPFIPPTTLASTTPRALRALSLLGVRSIVQQPGDKPLALPVSYRGRDARIYDNPGALPRAWAVAAQRVVSDPLAAVLAPGFDPRREAVTERRIPGVGTQPGLSGPVRIVRYEDERVELEAVTTRPSLVVLSDTWYPGWHAEVDGQDAEIERVDYLLRGVPVSGPGTHRIVMTYRPLSFRLGWIISLLTALVLVAAVVRGRTR